MAIRVSIRGGNQSPVGASPSVEAIRVTEWATVNAVTTSSSGRIRRNGNHQAEDKEQVVDPTQDVPDAEPDETRGSLVPVGIQPDRFALIVSGQLEGSLRASGWKEPDHGPGLLSEPVEARLDRKIGLGRSDRILEEDVQQGLLPDQLGLRWQWRPADMGERIVPLVEGPVRRQ